MALIVRRGMVEKAVYMPPCEVGDMCPRYPAPGPVCAAVELSPAAWRGVKTAVGRAVFWYSGHRVDELKNWRTCYEKRCDYWRLPRTRL